jgi:hypothetical protein
LWPTIEKKLYDWIVNERAKGMRISTVRVLQESKRIAQEDNINNFKAYPSWVFGFMKKNNLSVHFSTSVGQKLPSDWEAEVAKFCSYLRENLFGVDACHFRNMDQVPISFDMPSSRTVYLKGAKEVSVATTGHERSNVKLYCGSLNNCRWFETTTDGNFQKKDCSERLQFQRHHYQCK